LFEIHSPGDSFVDIMAIYVGFVYTYKVWLDESSCRETRTAFDCETGVQSVYIHRSLIGKTLLKLAGSCQGEREECDHGFGLHCGGVKANWLKISLSIGLGEGIATGANNPDCGCGDDRDVD
jgi:hypothetical protein